MLNCGEEGPCGWSIGGVAACYPGRLGRRASVRGCSTHGGAAAPPEMRQCCPRPLPALLVLHNAIPQSPQVQTQVDRVAGSKPVGYTERHLVDEGCLGVGNWGQEMDYHLVLSGKRDGKSISELMPYHLQAGEECVRSE